MTYWGRNYKVMKEKQQSSSLYDSLFEGQNTFSIVPEVEMGILAALLCPSFQLLNVHFSYLKPEYFENQILRSIAKVTLDYFTKFKCYPSLEIIEHEIRNLKSKVKPELLNEYMETLDTLEDSLSNSNDLIYYRDSLQEFLKTVYLRNNALDLLHNLNNKDLDSGKVDTIVYNISHPPSLDVDIGIEVLNLKQLPRDFTQTVPTFFESLDICLKGGGLGQKQLGVVGGVSGVGKSTLLIQLGAAAIVKGKHVVHYTLELEDSIIAERYVRRLSGYEDIFGYTEDAFFDADITYKLGKYRRFGGSLTIKELLRCRALDMEAHLNQLQMVRNILPDLILIDSPDDMRPNEHYRDMDKYEKYWEIYMDIIEIGKKFKVPVWVITQLDRKSLFKKQVQLDNTSDSWKKVAKATVFLGISQTKEEKKKGLLRITILKNTHGREYVTILFKLDLDTMLITDMGYVDELGKESKELNIEEEGYVERE